MKSGRALAGIFHLIILAICMWIVPAFILKNHIVWGLIAGFCCASALIFLTRRVWKPWITKGDSNNVNLPS